jgi:hypothetical protein
MNKLRVSTMITRLFQTTGIDIRQLSPAIFTRAFSFKSLYVLSRIKCLLLPDWRAH